MSEQTKLQAPEVETPATLPNNLSEIDLLRLQITFEKIEKMEAQMGNLQLQLQMGQKEYQETLQTKNSLMSELMKKYVMNESDVVNRFTGIITRRNGPKPAASA